MRLLTGTLVADGSSDRLLKPILDWLLKQWLPTGTALDLQVPDWGRFPRPVPTLATKVLAARQFFQADVYFLHRDAEKESWATRYTEITTAAHRILGPAAPFVRVIPVRMTEAWLLHNEPAIREAAENPSGRMPLPLPTAAKLDALPKPKEELLRLLREASGLSGRHLQKFRERERRRLHRLADIQQETGFGVLRGLPAFDALEAEVKEYVAGL